MNKEKKKTVKWIQEKIPSELEDYLFPDTQWSDLDKEYEGEVLDIVIGVWDSFYVVKCSDGKIRRININKIKEIRNDSI